jgi:hypothetical protein
MLARVMHLIHKPQHSHTPPEADQLKYVSSPHLDVLRSGELSEFRCLESQLEGA